MRHHPHFIEMIFIMILAGALSTMNMWVSSWEHIRFSLNDVYMITLMTGWMVLFMSLLYKSVGYFLFGILLVLGSFYAIRTQLFVSYKQYLKGMIPHHSMAIHMSNLQSSPLADSIIKQQEAEIQFMRRLEISKTPRNDSLAGRVGN